jgi:hypothetical protein
LEDVATIIGKPAETLRAVHGNGPFKGQLMCGDMIATDDTILILYTNEILHRIQINSYISYDITQGKVEDQPRWVLMAGNENTWDLLRLTGLIYHINDKSGQLLLVNQAGDDLHPS